jgi:hypothetical protein
LAFRNSYRRLITDKPWSRRKAPAGFGWPIFRDKRLLVFKVQVVPEVDWRPQEWLTGLDSETSRQQKT